jgi:hypothetical protein
MADRKISDLTALTTPAAGDFLPIVDISEAAAASKNKRITIEELMRGVPDGTAAAPGIAFETDPNTGIYSPGADQLAVATNGTERLRITSAGNVGIGTTSPDAKLEVSGSSAGEVELTRMRIEGQTNNPMLRILADEANKLLTIGTSGSTAGTELRFNTKASTTESARIDSSGRLLVGTSSARAISSVTSQVQIEGTTINGSSFGLFSNANDATGSFLLLSKSRSGSVGGNGVVLSGDTLGTVRFAGNDGSANIAAAQITAQVDGTPGANDMPGRLVFSVTANGAASPTEAMRINNSGSLLYGQAATSTPGFGNTVVGLGYDNGSKIVHVSNENGAVVRLNRNSDGAVMLFRRSGAGSAVGAIEVTTTSTAFVTSSDYRLKENIAPVSGGITRLRQLKPSRFNFIADPDTVVDGFLAHEVQTIVPEAITGEKDAVDDEGNPEYQGIDQSKLVPLLTAALQEAIAKIESLEARLTAAGL